MTSHPEDAVGGACRSERRRVAHLTTAATCWATMWLVVAFMDRPTQRQGEVFDRRYSDFVAARTPQALAVLASTPRSSFQLDLFQPSFLNAAAALPCVPATVSPSDTADPGEHDAAGSGSAEPEGSEPRGSGEALDEGGRDGAPPITDGSGSSDAGEAPP